MCSCYDKLSNNLSLKEVLKSNTAERLNIDNSPTLSHLKNLKYLAEEVFQPLRDFAGSAIHVNSGYRGPELNTAIGGSKSSHHMIGCALDLDNDNKNSEFTNVDIFNYIKDYLPFTQLIWEFGDDKSPAWVHVAIQRGRENEKSIKKAMKVNGKTIYKLMTF